MPQHCRRTLPTQASARDYGHSWASLGQSLVGSLLLSPGSLFCLCPPRVYFPVLCKFWWLYGGVNGDLLQEGLSHTQVCCPRAPAPAAVHCWPIPPHETLKHGSGSISVGSLGPGAHKVCLSPLSVSGGYGVWFKHDFAPPTILLGLLLCPWTWGISSQSLQHQAAAALRQLWFYGQ